VAIRVVDEHAFLPGLAEHGLLLPTGVSGVYGRGAEFERVVLGFDGLVTASVAEDGAEVLRFPPTLPRTQLEQSGYLKSFPHLAGTIFGFEGSESEAVELGELAERHADWSRLQTMTGVTLQPAVCYPVYAVAAADGPLPDCGRLFDVQGWCFRNEPSDDPARMQSFRMRELVRLGSSAEVASWKEAWVGRAQEILERVGLDVSPAPANDPFFGRTGRMLAANQRDLGLKTELVGTIASAERPTPLASINLHLDHFGVDFGIRGSDGDLAHTACVGFGLERVALALFREHGLELRSWPPATLALLGLEVGA
jgi:seryl-tRNA synthetase